jgi:hypothetical protein
LRHCTNAARAALEPLLDGADAAVVLELLEALLPQAASARLALTAASAGKSRRIRRRVLIGEFMWVLSGWC